MALAAAGPLLALEERVLSLPAAPTGPVFSTAKIQAPRVGTADVIERPLPSVRRSRPQPVGISPLGHFTLMRWVRPGGISNTGSKTVPTTTLMPCTRCGRRRRMQRRSAPADRPRAPAVKRKVQRRALLAGMELVAASAEVETPLRATARAGQRSVSERVWPAGTVTEPVTVTGSTLASASAGSAARATMASAETHRKRRVAPCLLTVSEPNIGLRIPRPVLVEVPVIWGRPGSP